MAASHLAASDSSESWAALVASQADFPDERLNTRFGIILKSLADKPLDSFPQACNKPSEAQALYRFLENPRIEVENCLQPLVDATLDLCRGQKSILAVQDSSSANYASLVHTKGLGKLNDSDALGLHFHTTIAVQSDGIVRGLLHQTFWSRPPHEAPIAGQRKSRPIELKESSKWLDGIEAAEAALDNLPVAERPRLVHVFDREGDIHEVLQRITDSPHGAIIRVAQTERNLAPPHDRVDQAIRSAAVLGIKTLELPARHGAKKRSVRLELRSVQVTLQPNDKKHPGRLPVAWTLVQAKELDPPADVEALHWLLWTTEAPDNSVKQIDDVLRCYKLRWLIEDFHLTLKSGCQIEELRLETADRLTKAIIMYSAVALRVVSLRDLARLCPDDPCTIALTEPEWHALYAYIHRKPAFGVAVPTIRQAVLWIGRLGGHLGRKRDPMPGVRQLWRGLRDLTLILAGYQAGQRR